MQNYTRNEVGRCKITLGTSGDFQKVIMNWSSRAFYHGKLLSGSLEVSKHSLNDLKIKNSETYSSVFNVELFACPFVFIDTFGDESLDFMENEESENFTETYGRI
jgi:hypothetical protein